MTHLVKWDKEHNSGKVSEKAFFSELPEELNKGHFMAVDQYRENRKAAIMAETIDYANKHGLPYGEGTGIMVNNIPMGGLATGDYVIDSEYNSVFTTSYKEGDAMKEVMAKSRELYSAFANDVNESEITTMVA